MTVVFDSHLNNLKANILNGIDPDGNAAIAAINKEIEYLEAQTYIMRRYADFAKLIGETYTIPANVAAWLELAVEHEPYGNRAPLQYVNVREYAGRTWIAATDGYRLHAHAVDLPVGIYLMVDNKLRQVDSIFPDWTTVVPQAPVTIAVDEYAITSNTYAAWNFLNGNLVKFDPKRPYKLEENYRLNKLYFDEALSFDGTPSFALAEATEEHKHVCQRKMMISWPDAFALIMPAMPER